MDTPKSIPVTIRERLKRPGGRLIGTFVKLPATEAVDIVAAAGFDFAIVDREHSQLDEGQALQLVRHGVAAGMPMVVRVPECDGGAINRTLEAGASGIQLSSVRSVKEVLDLGRAVRFAPGGARSVSLAHSTAGYGAVSLREAVEGPPPLLIGQIETAVTEDPLDEILSAGLDVAFIGVTDLTVDLGFDAERVRLRVREIAAAAAAAGVALGIYAADGSSVPDGAVWVAVSSDLAMLRAAAGSVVADAH